MASKNILQSVKEYGRFTGFANLMHKENHTWWGTHTWWVQSLVWLLLLNGIVALLLWVVPATIPTKSLPSDMTQEQREAVEKFQETMDEFQETKDIIALQAFFSLAGLATAIGVAIIGHGAIIGEKQSGTAAWILSKPVSRPMFILSKFTALSINTLLILIGLQSLILYLQIALVRENFLPLLSFLGGVGMLAMHLLFYLSLTLMLGTLFNNRKLVLGIPLVIVFASSIPPLINTIPWLAKVMPWALTASTNLGTSLALALVQQQPLPSLIPIVATALWVVLFIAVAIWRFAREDF